MEAATSEISAQSMTSSCSASSTRPGFGVERLEDKDKGLDCVVHHDFMSADEQRRLFETVKAIPWYRVKYKSERYANQCETPCWTSFYGGVRGIKPFQEIPPIFDDIIAKVRKATGNVPYNAVLVRLYFDGQDNIAWHTDGRTFLGPEPTIASLSLGASATFSLRRMNEVWPCTGTKDGGVDVKEPQRHISLKGGSLMVMQGKTQQEWHHKVPIEKGRGPRININFRYILPERDETTVRGVRAFYKYMVSGDAKTEDWDITAKTFTYSQIVQSKGPMYAFTSRVTQKSDTTFESAITNNNNNTTDCKIASISASASASVNVSASLKRPATDETSEGSTSIKNSNNSNSALSECEWTCSACTFINTDASARSCSICITTRSKQLAVHRDREPTTQSFFKR